MSFFDGSTSSKKKEVNLGGRSLKKSGAVVETKEQLAERNAKARVQREHVRAENSAALCISLSWRVRRARSAAISRIDEVLKFALNDSLHSASVLSPNHLGPPSQSIIDQSIRALCCCFNVFMFLRKSANHKLRLAFRAQYDPPPPPLTHLHTCKVFFTFGQIPSRTRRLVLQFGRSVFL
jgi:hypothetical protein